MSIRPCLLNEPLTSCLKSIAMETKHDTNNNSMEKSYSLRPRAAARSDQEVDQTEPWKPRCRTKKKPKQKSVPLSKYRRKTANARERFRMREINEAFEALRRVIPHLSASCENSNEKLTKISTLRFAMKYITALDNALQDPDFDSDGDSFFSEWTSTPSDIRESSTPSSVNGYSDIYEQFFSPSSSSESSPSACSPYGLSALHTPPPPCEFTPSPSNFSRLCVPPVYPTEPELPVKDSGVEGDERVNSSSTQTPSFSRCSLLSSSVTHSSLEEDLSHHLLSSALSSCTPSLLDGLEEFSTPSDDLDDYLLT